MRACQREGTLSYILVTDENSVFFELSNLGSNYINRTPVAIALPDHQFTIRGAIHVFAHGCF